MKWAVGLEWIFQGRLIRIGYPIAKYAVSDYLAQHPCWNYDITRKIAGINLKLINK
jgi:hypothetical protein